VEGTVFEVEPFVQACTDARRASAPQDAVAALVGAAVAQQGWIEEAVASLGGAGPRFLHRRPDLTVYCLVMGAGFRLPPHDHRIWAVSGIASGCETNELYRRGTGGLLDLERTVVSRAGDVLALEPDAIHASWTDEPTAAVHVYGGDILATPRATWASPRSAPRPARLVPPGTAEEAEAHLAAMRSAARARRTEEAVAR
jgi:predicted metal-dependent enzyme (double-stranded beta helix superfamily)